jgi:hypothetical protein
VSASYRTKPCGERLVIEAAVPTVLVQRIHLVGKVRDDYVGQPIVAVLTILLPNLVKLTEAVFASMPSPE